MSDSTIAMIIVAFVIIGNLFFRDLFQWIWLILGLGFFGLLVVFHVRESIADKRRKKPRDSLK